MPVFFERADYALYSKLLAAEVRRWNVEIWAYALMPNHVHLIACPETGDGLARAIGEAHRKYAVRINRRMGWAGHLWQERFWSYPMNESHLFNAVRYVLRNPVQAGLAGSPFEWEHSSAVAHLRERSDGLVVLEPLARRIEDFRSFLASGASPAICDRVRAHLRSGFPLGDERFVTELEEQCGRRLRPARGGPRPNPEYGP